jgi:excisionase family DNA binding protein
MITKNEIVTAASSALAHAVHAWLNEHREPLLHAIAQALAQEAPPTRTQKSPLTNEEPLYLTQAEVAKRWRCCVHTVQRRIRAGELPRLGMNKRHILIPLDAVMKFEKSALVPLA